jgi:hypothetical protein
MHYKRCAEFSASVVKCCPKGQEHVMEKHDVTGLEKRIEKLSSSLSTLRIQEELRELLLVIHGPGWTTPAELRFALEIVESMQTQTTAMAALSQGLLAASRAVGQK